MTKEEIEKLKYFLKWGYDNRLQMVDFHELVEKLVKSYEELLPAAKEDSGK